MKTLICIQSAPIESKETFPQKLAFHIVIKLKLPHIFKRNIQYWVCNKTCLSHIKRRYFDQFYFVSYMTPHGVFKKFISTWEFKDS